MCLYDKMHYMDYVMWSAQSQLVCAFVSLFTHQGLLTYGLFALYASSMLYWGPLHDCEWMRDIDITFVTSNILAISIYYSKWFCCGYRPVWLYGITGCGLVYAFNECVFYLQTNQLHAEYQPAKPQIYKYFTSAYTFPGTYQRQRCLEINMIVHCMFLHVMPAIIWLYCVYNSNYYIQFYYEPENHAF